MAAQMGKRKKGNNGRLLITVNVVGSAGPLRFLMSEDDVVAAVIQTALKCYAREGRLPVLGSNANDFLLYHVVNFISDALSPREKIGCEGGRNFVLCKKQVVQVHDHKGNGWKAWLSKSFSFKMLSH